MARRIKICGTSYKLKSFNYEQKHLLSKKMINPNDWMLISESDSYLRIVKKDSIETNSVIVKNISKYGRAI